ncbi:MAG: AAA family ATPase [Thermoanaerobaculia bacterium]|nr:AAA family ATPase [Thermoanaerobaculia bacterium]
MNSTYCDTFDLTAPPFSKEILDRDLWLPPSKEGLVRSLVDAMESRESVLLTGEPGVGKTCILRALRQALPDHGFRLTYCSNATLGRRDFYRQICHALGLAPKATAAAVFYALSTHVEELGRDQIHPVFLIDEAHLLHQDTLDHLHIVMNYQWDSRALLSLILVGLPELDDRMRLRRNRSLYSRLARRLRIDPLSPSDTADYIWTRLALVGSERQIFTEDAIGLLHEATGGTLRHLDRLATAALRQAARYDKTRVERDLIATVISHDHLA